MWYSIAGQGFHAWNLNPAALVLDLLEAIEVAVVAALPEDYHIVVALYFGGACSYLEIAVMAACPLGTVHSPLRRGRRML